MVQSLALAKSTGAGIFAIDVDLPDMVFATLRMNPRLGGPMISFDATGSCQLTYLLLSCRSDCLATVRSDVVGLLSHYS